jgi:hypothetical protein
VFTISVSAALLSVPHEHELLDTLVVAPVVRVTEPALTYAAMVVVNIAVFGLVPDPAKGIVIRFPTSLGVNGFVVSVRDVPVTLVVPRVRWKSPTNPKSPTAS